MGNFIKSRYGLAVFIAGTLVLSGCSTIESEAGADEPATAEPSASSQSVEASAANESATAEPASSGEYGPTIEGMPTLKDLAKDKNGVWRKTTIMPDDPAYEIKDSVLMEGNVREMWSEEDIKEAHRLAINLSVDAIDTAANGALGDTASMESWWETNQGKFHPAYKEVLREGALSTDVNLPIVYKVDRRTHSDPTLDYGLVYGENEVHIKNRTIDTYRIHAGELPSGKAIAVGLSVSFSNVVEIDGERNIEGAGGGMQYTFVKDEATGQLLATGYSTTFKTQPLR